MMIKEPTKKCPFRVIEEKLAGEVTNVRFQDCLEKGCMAYQLANNQPTCKRMCNYIFNLGEWNYGQDNDD